MRERSVRGAVWLATESDLSLGCLLVVCSRCPVASWAIVRGVHQRGGGAFHTRHMRRHMPSMWDMKRHGPRKFMKTNQNPRKKQRKARTGTGRIENTHRELRCGAPKWAIPDFFSKNKYETALERRERRITKLGKSRRLCRAQLHAERTQAWGHGVQRRPSFVWLRENASWPFS